MHSHLSYAWTQNLAADWISQHHSFIELPADVRTRITASKHGGKQASVAENHIFPPQQFHICTRLSAERRKIMWIWNSTGTKRQKQHKPAVCSVNSMTNTCFSPGFSEQNKNNAKCSHALIYFYQNTIHNGTKERVLKTDSDIMDGWCFLALLWWNISPVNLMGVLWSLICVEKYCGKYNFSFLFVSGATGKTCNPNIGILPSCLLWPIC